jgi:hypothetical protein
VLGPCKLVCDHCTVSRGCKSKRVTVFLQELLASCDPALADGNQPFSSHPAPHAAAGPVQKQQRAIMAELRGLVPSAAAALLAAPLLEAGQVLLPVPDAAGPAADAQNTASTAASQLRGWRACMAALQQDYPSLPGLLLAGSLADLAAGGTPPPAQAAAWAQLLLQHAVLSDSSSRSQGEPGFAWQPTRAQVLQVVATCITALQISGPAQPAAGPKQPAAVLLDAAVVLLQHIDDRMPHSAASAAAATCALQVILHST